MQLALSIWEEDIAFLESPFLSLSSLHFLNLHFSLFLSLSVFLSNIRVILTVFLQVVCILLLHFFLFCLSFTISVIYIHSQCLKPVVGICSKYNSYILIHLQTINFQSQDTESLISRQKEQLSILHATVKEKEQHIKKHESGMSSFLKPGGCFTKILSQT